MHFLVAGAGISGLSAAFHLARRFPQALISVFEKNPCLGGWLNSERVQIPHSDAQILLEAGPRTLRPNANSVLELINLLHLQNSVITTPRSSPAAKRRFLHIPGSPGLVEIPNSIYALLKSPLFSVLVSAVLSEALKLPNRSRTLSDESVDTFLSRRFGESFARTFGSALVHGIYAADSRTISVRAAFPFLWDAEQRGWGSVVRGFLRPHTPKQAHQDYELGDIPNMMKDVAVYSFRDGMRTLSDALVQHLQRLPNVQIHTADNLKSIRVKDNGALEVSSSSKVLEPTHIVSTIPLPTLHTLLPPHLPLPHLLTNASSSVTVVNMVFKAPSPFPEGFGYLIPRARNNTPTTILGTVFDSCALSEQDFNSQFTKITVMVKGATTPSPNVSDIIAQLSHHLASPLPSPLYTRIVRNENCIPVLSPGHLDRMDQLKSALQEGPWKGRLQVIGAGVGGVSVGDCVEAGKRASGAW